SHRFAGLETAYGDLLRLLDSLDAKDRFVLVPFDREPASGGALKPATQEAVASALSALRERPLGAGTDVAAAVAVGHRLVGDNGRLVLLTDGAGGPSSKALLGARGKSPLFTLVTGDEAGENYRGGSTDVLAPGTAEIEADLFFRRILMPP